jgi:nitroimidazol reductase NimA-like FMN-containing flavoprotein (pyridoxamine 5'-phosphate oxidase superfamily)
MSTTQETPLSGTDRTRLRRSKERGQASRSALYEVLDSGMICHLGVTTEGGPVVLPTGFGRIGDTLYLHGSTGAHSLITARSGPVCVTVTHLDGIVLARSAFHQSVNYRSAVVFGHPRLVHDADEKLAGLRAVTERLAPGQWDVVRPPDRKELARTAVLALSLAEASVKVRTGPPVDDAADYDLDVWAGVLPVHQVFGEPIPDPRLRPGLTVPDHVRKRA